MVKYLVYFAHVMSSVCAAFRVVTLTNLMMSTIFQYQQQLKIASHPLSAVFPNLRAERQGSFRIQGLCQIECQSWAGTIIGGRDYTTLHSQS